MIKTPVTLRWARAKRILTANNLVAGTQGQVLVPSSGQGNYKVHVHFDARGYLDGAECGCKDFYKNAKVLQDAKHEAAPSLTLPNWVTAKHNVVVALQNGEEHGLPLHYSGGHVVLICKHILTAATVVMAQRMGWTVPELLALGS